MHFVDGMIERGIPLSVFHFDCFWMKEFEWTSFIWDKRSFPDPAGLIRRLHDKGVKVCVWINPYIAQKSPLFKEGLDNNYFVNTGSGDVWQWDRWQPGMALVDFTNGLARGWYLEISGRPDQDGRRFLQDRFRREDSRRRSLLRRKSGRRGHIILYRRLAREHA